MASFTVNEVMEAVFESADSEEVDDDEEVEGSGDEFKLKEWLATYPGPAGFNHKLFSDISLDILKPVIRQCSVGCGEGLHLNELEKGK